MGRFTRRATVVSVALVVFTVSPANRATGQPSPPGTPQIVSSHGLVYTGTADFAALAAQTQAAVPTAVPRVVKPLRLANRATAAAPVVPNPPNTPMVNGTGGAGGFVALTDMQQAVVGNNGDVEPPDQALCAHAGVMVEGVNLALQVLTEGGAALSAPVPLSAFFGLPPAYNSSLRTYGPFLSDPRCYYDGQTGRWFIAVLQIDVNPYSGKLGYRGSELLAVSQTSDPRGRYGLFSIDATADGLAGTTALPNCPCFGDQPRIGADAKGFYISADTYPIHGLFNSNGGTIWAMSKQGLAAAATGAAAPTLVTLNIGATIIQGYPANAVQPAVTPEGGTYAPDREYFLSTPDFNGFATSGGAGASSVVLWTISGTSTLGSATPSLTVTDSLVPSEPYTPPVNAAQKPGPRLLGDRLKVPLPPISVNDDRMQQVEYTGGRLYSSLNTGVGPRSPGNRSGVAWFIVAPHGTAGTMAAQGYLAVNRGASLMYPAIGLTPAGKGVMTFSVSGPTLYPSHAYMLFDTSGPNGSIYLAGPGTAPEDGFTCYAAEGFGPACRWGDYSAATADGRGNLVMATEMIPNTTRTNFANWGTFISVRPA